MLRQLRKHNKPVIVVVVVCFLATIVVSLLASVLGVMGI